MTQFINKSSQTIPILRLVLEKMIDFYDILFIIFTVIKRQVSGSVLNVVLVKPETYNL